MVNEQAIEGMEKALKELKTIKGALRCIKFEWNKDDINTMVTRHYEN